MLVVNAAQITLYPEYRLPQNLPLQTGGHPFQGSDLEFQATPGQRPG